MLLAIDRGNTQTKLSLCSDGKLHDFTIIEDADLSTGLTSFIERHLPMRAIISDVRSKQETQALVSLLQIPSIVLESTMPLPFKICYETPDTLGRDRIANAAGAVKCFGNGNLLVVDCGSCMTYTLIASGELLGGSIAPGIHMRFSTLHAHTGALPLITMRTDWTASLVGKNTTGSIESGVLMGILSETDGLIAQYREQFPQLIVIITGGDTSFFEKHLKSSIFAAPYLTHEGLHEILRHHSA